MALLVASDLHKSYGGDEILRGAGFAIEPGEKVALIGRNGTGKTTLLRLIAGIDEPDRGRVSIAAWARAAYLPQVPGWAPECTVLGRVVSSAADLHAMEDRMREVERLMASPDVSREPGRLEAAMEEYAHLREHFEHAGGYTLETRARMALFGLGFREEEMARPLSAQSGGWRVRAELARALLGEPDLLLLDEPTNHLDASALEWLEDYLRSFPGACVMVSHDRALLDAVTTRTLELEDHAVASYPGSYSKYASLKAERTRLREQAWERREEEIARLEDYVRRYKAGQRADLAKSREKMIARLRSHQGKEADQAHGGEAGPPARAAKMRVSTRPAPASGKMVARLRKVEKRFDSMEVLKDVSLEIHRGDRIGLLGPNGAGKTTLLQIVAGLEPPTAGTVTLGAGVRPHYFAQEAGDALDPSRTVLDEVLADRPLTPEQVRGYLGRFLFSGDEVFKRTGMLSGGERQRLNLAKMLLDSPNLLLLDEPTNHLDIPSREALEEALFEFDGTMVIATHDRYLLDRLANRILTVEERGITDFRGTYGEQRAARARQAARALQESSSASRRPAGAGQAARRGREAAQPVKPTFDEVAERINAVERDLHDAAGWLGDPDLYRDPNRAREMRLRYEEAEKRLAELYQLLEEVE